MAQGGEGLRIPFAGEDRADDALAGPPAEIADDIRELDVHLRQRLLHPLEAGAKGAYVVAALTPVRSRDADLGRRVKRVPEEAVRVEFQQPLALLHVAFTPGEILGVPRVHQIDLKAPALQDLVQRNPVDARRLHRDGRDPTLL